MLRTIHTRRTVPINKTNACALPRATSPRYKITCLHIGVRLRRRRRPYTTTFLLFPSFPPHKTIFLNLCRRRAQPLLSKWQNRASRQRTWTQARSPSPSQAGVRRRKKSSRLTGTIFLPSAPRSSTMARFAGIPTGFGMSVEVSFVTNLFCIARFGVQTGANEGSVSCVG